MPGNKLVTNLIAGVGIIGSLATSGFAGYKVFASRGAEVSVPEIAAPSLSPTPNVINEEVSNSVNNDEGVVQESPALEISTEPVVEPVIPLPNTTTTNSNTESFPVAPQRGGSNFEDEGEDEDELEQQETKVAEKQEDKDDSEDHDEDK